MEWASRLRHRRYHVSFLLAWFALGLCVGLLGSRYLDWSIEPVWLLVSGAILLGVRRQQGVLSIGLVLFVGVLVGGERGTNYLRAAAPYSELVGQQCTVKGRIMADPVMTSGGELRLDVGEVRVCGNQLPGETYMILQPHNVKRGDYISVHGKVAEGFGSYQATIYRADLHEVQRPPDAVRDVRERFGQVVRKTIPEPEASLGLGFVVGQRSALPPELDDQLRAVGLTHIVVASGYNLTILVRFARRVLAGISRFMATASSMFLMLSFAVFSGFSPSMNRAVVVTGLSLMAWHVGRRFHPVLLLLYVAAGTSYWNPVYIWSDIGWYLSFLAFGGILVVAPAMSRLLFRDKQAPAVGQLLIETSAAQLMTLPLLLMIFGLLPNLSLVANLLVAPVIPFAMLATTLAGLSGWFMPFAAPVMGWLAHIATGYVVAIADWLAMIPGSQSELSLEPRATLAVYVAIAVFIGVLLWKLRLNLRAISVVE